MLSEEGTQLALGTGLGRGRRGARPKESSRRAAVFRMDHAINRAVTEWESAQGGIEQAASRFQQYRSRRPLSLVRTTQLHSDQLTSELRDWTLRQQANDQHQLLRREEGLHASDLHRRRQVPRIGSIPAVRPDGVIRWMYCQVNGLAEPKRRTEKIDQILELARTHEIDGAALCEVGVNWSMTPRRRWFHLGHWLNSKSVREIRASTSNNIHGPKRSQGQYGGTGLVLFNSLLQYGQSTAHDHRQLGRWASWVLSNTPLHRTRVVVAYCPGRSRREGLKTVYQQHIRYIQQHNLAQTPYQLFLNDLVAQLKCWKAAGDRILLFIDANEHVISGKIGKSLTHRALGLHEISHKFWGTTPPHTYIDGSLPIDGVFASPELEVSNYMSLSFHESVGDHRTMIVEITSRSMFGQHLGPIVRPTTRRLTTKQPGSVRQYNECFLSQCYHHNIRDRTASLLASTQAEQYPVSPDTADKILSLHSQMDKIRTCSERGCRKILKPAAPYSPVISFWNDKIHAYQQLIRIKSGSHSGINRGHAYRTARRKHILDPWALSIDDCKEGIRLAKIRQVDLRKAADAHRKQYLSECLQHAIDADDEAEQKAIRNRMRRESSKLAWRRINRVTRPPTGRSCLQAQEVVNGRVITHTDKAGVEGAIQRECETRFRLGHSAPIEKTLLGEEVGYLSDSKVAQDIIMGTYEIPADMEEGTALLLTEIGKVGNAVREKGPPSHLLVTKKDYQTFWPRLNENTSSSFSGFHLGHHMSAAKSDEMSELLSDQMNLIISSGVCPTRWGVALQVLLEKVAGDCLVSKLRSIQLYEADYNWFNKLVFNDKAMSALQSTGLMPEEHFSQKQSLAEDAVFDKVLTLDLSRQSRLPMALVSIDAAQCYDRVNHTMMSLVWLALGVQQSAIAIILNCLQNMTIFTRTGFGDSSTSFGGPDQLIPFCGLGQGSKAAPASWLQLSTTIINAYCNQGYGAVFADPITQRESKSVGCVYVDDTDIYTADPSFKTVDSVIKETVQAVPCWSRCLSATGGAIKAAKSGWYLISYENIDGEWISTEVPWDLSIPLPEPEGDTVIKHHDMSEAFKSLGVFTSPMIGHADHLLYIQSKVADWIISMTNGHLPAALAWMSYIHQLWPGLRYGLGTLTNCISEASRCLDGTDVQMLSFLGINKNVRKGLRRLPQTYGGFGLLSLPIEQHICRVNLFCQHFGSPSTIGNKLLASVHWLKMQLGCGSNPLELDFRIWGHLATSSWITSFWEGLCSFPGDMIIRLDDMPPQRIGDKPLMEIALLSGLRGHELAAFNRCRCAGHFYFLSDIVTANGLEVSRQYTSTVLTPLSSRLSFPPEHPTTEDWGIWTSFWTTYGMSGHLGEWTCTPHFTWPWIHDSVSDLLYEEISGGWRQYRRKSGRTRLGSGYVMVATQTEQPSGDWVSVRHVTSDGLVVVADPQPGPPPFIQNNSPESVWDLLLSWGGEWMWSNIHFPEDNCDPGWLMDALHAGTLVGCTDGSYNGKRSTALSSAGWILYDTKSDLRLAGSFCEHSPAASSYRGEMLGLCALQLLLLALDTWQPPSEPYPVLSIFCDNEKAGERAHEEHRRVKPSWSCADVLRSFRNTKNILRIPIQFSHVSAHMDELLPWDQLSLAEKLNCMCDSLAKDGLRRGMESGYADTHNLLPNELSAVMFPSGKASSDPADYLRQSLGHREAQAFYTTEKDWSLEKFNLISWDDLHATLLGKPLGFRIWLSKQSSDFCATGRQMKRCKMSDDDRCPSCWKKNENAGHLCICPSEARSSLLDESIRDMEKWMAKDNNTDPGVLYWIPKYIRGRGRLQFTELGSMSSSMKEIAKEQDIIGWRNFTEGRVCTAIKRVQGAHLAHSESLLNADMWMKGFISKLLHMTHAQWILRNFTLHDSQSGFLRLKDRLRLLAKIEELSKTDASNIPEESRFLLEIDTNALAAGDVDSQDYWIHAMEAARSVLGPSQPSSIRSRQQPKLRKLGTFMLLEEIRSEHRTRLSCNNGTKLGKRQPGHAGDMQACLSEANRMAQLASNRRRKPD